ncbi:hypothetical protein P3TCK_17422 [Photobacterium profundum 3TCK]|uniref:Uncharacterized protein n=1 Tax=Photobacterium profundum 3TCK TaxID=314280 RepID=Q1YW38_9GAMM|nr:hypothetical protein P3TCK_17422 [Photobacterium profundum 3TCK]
MNQILSFPEWISTPVGSFFIDPTLTFGDKRLSTH